MVDRLSQARADLLEDLAPLLAAGRVSLYPPAQIVSPTIYIETSRGALQTSGAAQILVASFDVIVVTDGDTNPQNQMLDELIAKVVDTTRQRGRRITGWTAGTVDVGGTSQRSATVTVEIPIVARTLCDPSITGMV